MSVWSKWKKRKEPATETEKSQLFITRLHTICNGCQAERTYRFDPPLIGAKALKKWTEGGGPFPVPERCPCGALTCDIKIPLEASN